LDGPAKEILQALFPQHEVVMVPGRELLLGGGNIHCLTQQQPAPHKE
jgi:agmatine deiminase